MTLRLRGAFLATGWVLASFHAGTIAAQETSRDLTSEPPGDLMSEPPGDNPFTRLTPADTESMNRAADILEQRIFLWDEPESALPELDLGTWLMDLLKWIFTPRDGSDLDLPDLAGPPSAPPPGLFLAVAGGLLLLVLAWLGWTWGRGPKPATVGEELVPEDAVAQAPEQHLDEAALLAAKGRFRAALRSLYLASLVALDHSNLIAFDPTRTNWQTFRRLPRGAARKFFREFTVLFDHKWYGLERTKHLDYERGRELARQVTEAAKRHPQESGLGAGATPASEPHPAGPSR